MVYLVLPAYNEESGLRELLAKAAEGFTAAGLPYEVIVVDDGSADGTADVAREFAAHMAVELVSHERNSGLAAAMRTGLSAALAQCSEGDVVVTMDADNTHDPAQIPSMLEALEGGSDVVIASRYRKGATSAGLTPFRSLMSSGAGLLFRAVMPTRGVRDYTCGYRAYRASTLRAAAVRYGDGLITQQGFACMVELLLRMRAIRARMSEVPLKLRYDLKVGASKMNVRRTVCDTLKLLLRWRIGLER